MSHNRDNISVKVPGENSNDIFLVPVLGNASGEINPILPLDSLVETTARCTHKKNNMTCEKKNETMND